MMKYTFHSCLAPKLQEFEDLKVSLGYKPNSWKSYLTQIDKAAIKFNLKSSNLTKEFVHILCAPSHDLSLSYHYGKVVAIREFCLFLISLDIPCYVPRLPNEPKGKFIPYIYSENELDRILKASDNLRVNYSTRYMSPIYSIPVLIRFLIATGTRFGEAARIKVTDIDWKNSTVRIRNTKSGKDRRIPISDSLISILSKHLEYKENLGFTKSKSAYFFSSLAGNMLSNGVANKWMRKIFIMAGIETRKPLKSPRIHDFRHTFAVRTFNQMERNGMNSYSGLPILSVYMGHEDVESTKYYITLTDAHRLTLKDKVAKTTAYVFPKYYEIN